MDCRSFAPVEHSELNAAGICRSAHFAAQGVDLSHQLTFGRSPNGGVAGHISNTIQIRGEHQRRPPQPGGGQRRLNARVARTNHCNVESPSAAPAKYPIIILLFAHAKARENAVYNIFANAFAQRLVQ